MSRAADVYSFAMIMWELFACKRLYEGHIASQVSSQWHPQRAQMLLSGYFLAGALSIFSACMTASARADLPAIRHNCSCAARWHPMLTGAEQLRTIVSCM